MSSSNLGTVYLEGNPVPVVSLVSPSDTSATAPSAIGGQVRQQIMLADALSGAPLDLRAQIAAASLASAQTQDGATGFLGTDALLNTYNENGKLARTAVARSNPRAPSPAFGGDAIIAGNWSFLAGTGATATLTTGPNGLPAIKIVTGVGNVAEISLDGLVGANCFGDVFVMMHGSQTLSNVSSISIYATPDANYNTNFFTDNTSGYVAPYNNPYEQGGAITQHLRKSSSTRSVTGSIAYPFTIGACKLRVTPLASTSATVYIYAVGLQAPPPKGRIAVRMDDGYDSQFKLGLESFASRGIPITLGVIASAQDFVASPAFSSKRQLRAFLDAGNALVTHGPYPNQGAGNLFSAYPGAPDPIAAAVADMVQNRQYLIDNDLLVRNAGRCYIWPQGTFQHNNPADINNPALLDAALAAGFDFAVGTTIVQTRGVNVGALSKYNRMALPIIGHLWAGTTAAEATNITAITTAISTLASSGNDGVIMLHRVLPTSTSDGAMGSAGNITIRTGDLETIAAAIKTAVAAGTLDAVTLPQMAEPSWWAQF